MNDMNDMNETFSEPVAVSPPSDDPGENDESGLSQIEMGQASVEYALVLLGAALVATLLISWATSTNLISSLFDYILGLIRGKAK
jgi:hypothetical protein